MVDKTIAFVEHAPDVSFLIVNYNGLHFLNECLTSIKESMNKYSYEIVVVDNASSDGSQSFLRNRSDIRYIESTKNLGFTGGNNLAADSARANIFILLNNDTLVGHGLDLLVDKALSENVGVVGAKLIYGNGRTQFSIGLHHHPIRLLASWLGLEKQYWMPSIFRRMQTNPAFYNKSHDMVDWVSGACFATPKKIWNKLGGMDESFFMYCEDVDYCLRVRNAGYQVAFISDALVTHYEGSGKVWIGEAALQRTANSYFIYLGKHYSVFIGRVTSLGLAAIFFLRAIAFGISNLFNAPYSGKYVISREKKSAYFAVARSFVRNAFACISTIPGLK